MVQRDAAGGRADLPGDGRRALLARPTGRRACKATGARCTWGYNPRGAACTLGVQRHQVLQPRPSFDFDTGTPAIRTACSPTASSELLRTAGPTGRACRATRGNAAKVFDITGNLREITKEGAERLPPDGRRVQHPDRRRRDVQLHVLHRGRELQVLRHRLPLLLR